MGRLRRGVEGRFNGINPDRQRDESGQISLRREGRGRHGARQQHCPGHRKDDRGADHHTAAEGRAAERHVGDRRFVDHDLRRQRYDHVPVGEMGL